MFAQEDPYIGKAYECLTKLSADEEKRLEYEAREKAIRDYNWQMFCDWIETLPRFLELTQRGYEPNED